MNRHSILLTLLALMAGAALVGPAQASDDVWTNAVGGQWGGNLNWSDNSAPGGSDTATFNLAATYTVSVTAAPLAIQSLNLNAPSGTVTLQSSGGVRTLGISSPGGSNRMFVRNGSTLNVGGTIANSELDLYIVDGLFVGNSATMIARTTSNVNVLGSLDIGAIVDGNLTAGTATYTINTGATMQLGGNMAIATDAVMGVNGVLNITGTGSALTQYNNVEVADVTVGSGFGGNGTINISTSGVMTTGTGQLTIDQTGRVYVNATATLNANGNILIDGGELSGAGTVNWAAGRTMDIVNGGNAFLTGSYYLTPDNATINVSGFGSSFRTVDTGNNLHIRGGATVNVSAQGLLRTDGILNIGTNILGVLAGNGTLLVDGFGSKVESTSTNASVFGREGQLANVVFRNQAVGSFVGGLTLANSPDTGTTANITVESGADLLNVGNISLATAGGLATSATLTITGLGSNVTLASSKVLTVGTATQSTATINVNNGGSLAVGSSGSTVLNATGTINIDGGIVDLKTLTQGGGKLNFQSGSLAYTGNLTVGAGGLLGSNLTLTDEHNLTLTGTATVNSESLLLIESGAGFSATDLTNDGQVILSGLDAVANAITTNNGLIRGEGRFVGSFHNYPNGELRAEQGKLIAIQGTNGSNFGRVNLLGGTAQYSNALNNFTSGTITGRGTLIIGGSGLNNDGNVSLSGGLSDVFGDVTNLTNSMARGITISGNAEVTFWDDVTNVGASLFKVTVGSSATVFGTYSGAGTTGGGNVYLEADISPGFSPAAVLFDNNVSLASTTKLNIELGGMTVGTQYDQVTVTGLLTLNGTLNVQLIDLGAGLFTPQAGQTFNILEWGTLSGTFDVVNLPPLAGLAWNMSQLYTSGVISVDSGLSGDYNNDKVVNAADYVLWRKNNNTAVTLPNDSTPGTSSADYDIWRSHFGQLPGSGSGGSSNAAVPEPTTALLFFLVAGAGICLRPRHIT